MDRAQVKTIVGVAGIILLLGLLAFVFYKGKLESQREDYEGTIVEKWASYSNTEEGSFPYYRLLVEADDGRRFPVLVEYEIYQRAETGSRIKKTEKGIEVSPAQTPRVTSGP